MKVRYRSGEGQVGQSQVCVMFYYHNKTKDNKNSDISGQEIQFLWQESGQVAKVWRRRMFSAALPLNKILLWNKNSENLQFIKDNTM